MIINPGDKKDNFFVSADNSFVSIFNASKELPIEEKISLLKKLRDTFKGKSKTLKK